MSRQKLFGLVAFAAFMALCVAVPYFIPIPDHGARGGLIGGVIGGIVGPLVVAGRRAKS